MHVFESKEIEKNFGRNFEKLRRLSEQGLHLSRRKKKILMITYNVILKENEEKKKHLPRTIIVQRKKESNTLYTINALNQLIYFLNDGKIDKNFEIPWKNYKNAALIITENGFEVLKIKLLEIKKLGENGNGQFNGERKNFVQGEVEEKRRIAEN